MTSRSTSPLSRRCSRRPTPSRARAAPGPLGGLNVMDLGSPRSAILSAIIFNALIIPALVPLALHGVRYRAIGATALLQAEPPPVRRRGLDPPLRRNQAHRPRGAQPPGRVAFRGVRGRYRILLGATAGVGKTYRMLNEGRQAKADGIDVIIGYLEPHDRPDTVAQAEGLEAIPRQEVEVGGLADRGDGHRGSDPARTAARTCGRACPYERGRLEEREALRRHRRDPRRRHRRDLDGERPAPRKPERPRLRADRRAGARDLSGSRARPS